MTKNDVPTAKLTNIRMISSLFSLLGGLIALYLLLYSLGLSPLVCPVSGCETVQKSEYSKLFGLPVSGYGLAIFVVLLGLSIYGLYKNKVFGFSVQFLLILLSGISILSYLYLTYLELFIIHAICFWCVTSSIMMLGVFITALIGRKE